MRRTGRIRIAALALITLLIGLPGLLRAGCSSCQTVSKHAGCHQESGPAFHPACCGGSATLVDRCCGSLTGTPSDGTEIAVAPKAPASAATCPVAAPVVFVQLETPNPVRLATDPLIHEGIGLYTLLSILLI